MVSATVLRKYRITPHNRALWLAQCELDGHHMAVIVAGTFLLVSCERTIHVRNACGGLDGDGRHDDCWGSLLQELCTMEYK